jgi:NADPH-dependent 2,4-dienoyl-CoA reductase/sulfur reductase-like enzyme
MRIVVVGASVAGVAACKALRSAGWKGEIVLVGEESEYYDRPPLSKSVLLGTTVQRDLELAAPGELDRLDVQRRALARADSLDLERGVVNVDGVPSGLAFDGLIIATGSHARQPPFPARDAHLLRTLPDAIALRDALRRARSVVVVGAGFIGLEVASSARALGLDVSILEYGPQPMARVLPPEVGRIFAQLHTTAGNAVRCGVEVVEVDAGTVRLADGGTLTADVIVVGVGAAPNDAWLAGSGLAIADGVVCDGGLRAAARVYAAGDVARWEHPVYGAIRVEHWTSARDHARVAAANLVAELRGSGASAQVADAIPYFWSDQLGLKVQMAGWTSGADAVHHSRDAERQMLLLGRADRLTAALTLNWPRELALHRRKLAARLDFAAAIEQAPGTPVG